MARYCYTCPACGIEYTVPDRIAPFCIGHAGEVFVVETVRDYRRENVGVAVGDLKKSREHSADEYARQMLPRNEHYMSPEDPDGKKGMAKWREEHTPAASNKKPYWPGEVDRKSF